MSRTHSPIPFDVANEKAPKSRSRRGCLTCRRRRLKCDEVGPVCGSCQAFGRSCMWGVKASFHSSRMRCLSEKDAASVMALHAKVRKPKLWKFVSNTEEVESCYHGSQVSSDEYNEFGDNEVDIGSINSSSHPELEVDQLATQNSSESYSRTYEAGRPLAIGPRLAHATTFTNMGSLESDQSPQERDLPSQPLPYVDSRAGFDDSTPTFTPSTAATPSSAGKDKMPSWPIGDRKKALLLISYLRETATWCETTDSLRHFSMQTAQDLLESQAYSAAAVAVASRQQDNTTGDARVETFELYDFARETICSLEAWQNNHMVLAGALQLCVYCMMSMEVNEWRLHLRGCAGTFQEMGWNGSSEGLPAACFWAFARIDIWAAYLTKQTTLIPTDLWIPRNYTTQEATVPLQDRYSNKAIWIFARIINELSEVGERGRETIIQTQNRPLSTEVLVNLWKELKLWRDQCPMSVKPLIELPPAEGDAFPMIIFGNQSAVCGNIFYHTGCILLLENGLKPSSVDGSSMEPAWHAQQIGGISTSTDNHANWVNNLQPLFIAAHYYHEPIEKIAVLRHLRTIEQSTGWKTGSRSTELRDLWGFG